MKLTNEQNALKILFKDFLTAYNSRNLSKLIGISHAGTFKILKKLEKDEILKSKRIGNTVVYSINFENSISKRLIDTILTIEAHSYNRWLEEFKSLDNKVYFAVLFGSILNGAKTAIDIDLLVVGEEENYKEIKKIVEEKNKLSNKKVHLIFQTLEEFKKDLTGNNKVTIKIIKKGIPLFGQDKYRKTIVS